MSDLTNQPRERVIQINTAANPAPTSALGAGLTQPHIVLSPNTPGGEPCRGFALTLLAPDSTDSEGGSIAAVAGTGGFTITLYRLNVALGVWAVGQPYTGAAYLDQLVSYDLGGGAALYAVIGNVATPGKILMLIAELP